MACENGACVNYINIKSFIRGSTQVKLKVTT